MTDQARLTSGDGDGDESRQRAHAAREALVGKTIAGRYVLRGLIGHGGMGAVYEAEHVGLGKRAAIKFVDPEFATDEKVVARFAREARAMSAIESAHIVTVFDAGTEDGRPYLVMELLRGEDLGQRLRRMRRIALGEAMHVIAQVLKGLARAHAAGIVHRDLKPDNVFLVKHDTDPLFAKIVDFGISKIERPRANTHPLALTGRGTVLGTPFYMSPEQAQASPDVDGRSDLYSVGAILFECLTGRPPHTGESYEQIILAICMRDAPKVNALNPSIPADVTAFVARALARDRSQRFASAEKMLAALHEVAPQERTRVPLDPVALAAETMLSAGVNPLGQTVLDGGVPQSSQSSQSSPAVRDARPSRPDDSKLTRLGMGSLDAVADVSLHPEAVARSEPTPHVKAEAKPDARSDARVNQGPPENQGPAKNLGSVKKKKGAFGGALATAAFATLTGVGVTYGVIHMLNAKAPVEAAPVSSSTSASSEAAGSAKSVSTADAAAAATPVAAAIPVAAAANGEPVVPGSAAVPAQPAPGRPVRNKPPETPLPALPRPPAKPLDIQRDLP